MGALITFTGVTYEFIRMSGRPQVLGMHVEDITRRGVNGSAFRQEAQHGEPFDVTAVGDYVSTDQAETTYLALAGAQGQLVEMVDDLGKTYGPPGAGGQKTLMLLKVECLGINRLVTAVGGNSGNPNAMMTLKFRLQATAIQTSFP